jgi:hypothetical protein
MMSIAAVLAYIENGDRATARRREARHPRVDLKDGRCKDAGAIFLARGTVRDAPEPADRTRS